MEDVSEQDRVRDYIEKATMGSQSQPADRLAIASCHLALAAKQLPHAYEAQQMLCALSPDGAVRSIKDAPDGDVADPLPAQLLARATHQLVQAAQQLPHALGAHQMLQALEPLSPDPDLDIENVTGMLSAAHDDALNRPMKSTSVPIVPDIPDVTPFILQQESSLPGFDDGVCMESELPPPKPLPPAFPVGTGCSESVSAQQILIQTPGQQTDLCSALAMPPVDKIVAPFDTSSIINFQSRRLPTASPSIQNSPTPVVTQNISLSPAPVPLPQVQGFQLHNSVQPQIQTNVSHVQFASQQQQQPMLQQPLQQQPLQQQPILQQPLQQQPLQQPILQQPLQQQPLQQPILQQPLQQQPLQQQPMLQQPLQQQPLQQTVSQGRGPSISDLTQQLSNLRALNNEVAQYQRDHNMVQMQLQQQQQHQQHQHQTQFQQFPRYQSVLPVAQAPTVPSLEPVNMTTFLSDVMRTPSPAASNFSISRRTPASVQPVMSRPQIPIISQGFVAPGAKVYEDEPNQSYPINNYNNFSSCDVSSESSEESLPPFDSAFDDELGDLMNQPGNGSVNRVASLQSDEALLEYLTLQHRRIAALPQNAVNISMLQTMNMQISLLQKRLLETAKQYARDGGDLTQVCVC